MAYTGQCALTANVNTAGAVANDLLIAFAWGSSTPPVDVGPGFIEIFRRNTSSNYCWLWAGYRYMQSGDSTFAFAGYDNGVIYGYNLEGYAEALAVVAEVVSSFAAPGFSSSDPSIMLHALISRSAFTTAHTGTLRTNVSATVNAAIVEQVTVGTLPTANLTSPPNSGVAMSIRIATANFPHSIHDSAGFSGVARTTAPRLDLQPPGFKTVAAPERAGSMAPGGIGLRAGTNVPLIEEEDPMKQQFDVLSTAGTFTLNKPAWAQTAEIWLYGGGGGGGGGAAESVAATSVGGGAGGSGGNYTSATFNANDISGAEAVVGVGGAGGAGGAAGSGSRISVVGVGGGETRIQLAGGGSILLRARGGPGGGNAGSSGGSSGGTNITPGAAFGSSGGSGTTTTGTNGADNINFAPSGGGGGAGFAASGVALANGGAGGLVNTGMAAPNSTGRMAGGTGAGGVGESAGTIVPVTIGGLGGGGGANSTTVAGGNGGNGAVGGGGGGGGAHRGALAGGTGGTGGTGRIVVRWIGQ